MFINHLVYHWAFTIDYRTKNKYQIKERFSFSSLVYDDKDPQLYKYTHTVWNNDKKNYYSSKTNTSGFHKPIALFLIHMQ
jgi:hypothetical protein